MDNQIRTGLPDCCGNGQKKKSTCPRCCRLPALLVLKKLDFPKTHDLLDLLAILTENEPLLDVLKPELRILNSFSVQFRYPGESATVEESQKALTAMKHARKYLKDRFSF